MLAPTLAGVVIMLASTIAAAAPRNFRWFFTPIAAGYSAQHWRVLAIWLCLGAMVVLCAYWVKTARDFNLLSSRRGAPKITLRQLVLAGCCTYAPLLLAAPFQSRDVYSYLAQGKMVASGFDPYSQAVTSIGQSVFFGETSADWRTTTTPYGPLHMLVTKLVVTAVGDHLILGIILLRLVAVVCLALTGLFLVKIAQRLGYHPERVVWLGLFNPLVMLHTIGGVHNESMMVACLTAALFLVLNKHVYLASILVGVAASVKFTGFLVLPFFIWQLTARRINRQFFLAVAKMFVALGCFLASMQVITWLAGTSWGWVHEMRGNDRVVNTLSLPTDLAEAARFLVAFNYSSYLPFNAMLEPFRLLCTALMLLAALGIWWWAGNKSPQHGIFWIFIAFSVLNAACLPWYFVPAVVLLGLTVPSARGTKRAMVLMIALCLAFSPEGTNFLYDTLGPVICLFGGLLCVHGFSLPRRQGALVAQEVA